MKKPRYTVGWGAKEQRGGQRLLQTQRVVVVGWLCAHLEIVLI